MRIRRPLDVECFPNWFLIKALDRKTKRYFSYEMRQGETLDTHGVRMLLAMSTIVTFNGNNYDVPMIAAALMGYDCATLKRLSDSIVKGQMRPWDFYKQFKIAEIPNLAHIDLMEVAPGVRISLKLYMGRMHSRKMQESPVDFEKHLTVEEMQIESDYCSNDLEGTADLLDAVEERLKLREFVGEQYGVDVMSKSDAQMGEAMIKARLPFNPKAPRIDHGTTFKYTAPNFIHFVTPQLQTILQLVQSVDFTINDASQLRTSTEDEITDADGNLVKSGIIMPRELVKLRINIGQSIYKFGIGGLHSQETSVWYKTIIGLHTISDHDASSFYPWIILVMRMYPPGCGPAFLEIFREMFDARIAAKRAKQKVKADGYKIGVNGTFGKLNSKYSFLFSPQMLIHVTITGQLCLLMLIEMLELRGVSVVSGNTDGIVLRTPLGLEAARDDIMHWFERITGFMMESTFYTAIYSRDVNNYIAFKYDGTYKGIGVFKESGIEKNKHPENDIVAESVREYLRIGVPIEQTICASTDIRKFLQIRRVQGGAVKNGVYLGKAIRWYYGRNEQTAIHVSTNGNKVADSQGGVPIMELPTTFPNDVNYEFYIDEAKKLLSNLGVTENV